MTQDVESLFISSDYLPDSRYESGVIVNIIDKTGSPTGVAFYIQTPGQYATSHTTVDEVIDITIDNGNIARRLPFSQVVNNGNVEVITLTNGQLTVELTAVDFDANFATFHLVGLDTDRSELFSVLDYTITDTTHIDLLESQPAGTKLIAIMRRTVR